MVTASLHDIKKELENLDRPELSKLLLRLGRFKKENKELLTYLLYEASDESNYIMGVKSEISELMIGLPKPSVYLTKKGLRKVVRYMDKYIRYSGNKETEADIRIFFCESIRDAMIPIHRSRVLTNLYNGQLKKIKAAVSKLHEDLQYDYQEQLKDIA